MDIDKELLDEFIQQIKNDFSYQHQYNRAYEYLVISDSTNNQEILVIDFTGVGADVTIDEQYFNCGNKASYNLEKLHKLINLLMAIEQMLAKQK